MVRRKRYGATSYPAHFPSSVDESSEPRLGHLPLFRHGQFGRKPRAGTQLPVAHPDLGWITLQSNRAYFRLYQQVSLPASTVRGRDGPGVRPALPSHAAAGSAPGRDPEGRRGHHSGRVPLPLSGRHGLSPPGRGRACPCGAAPLTVRLSREDTIPPPKRTRVRSAETLHGTLNPVRSRGRAEPHGGEEEQEQPQLGLGPGGTARPAGREEAAGGGAAAWTAASWQGSARRSLKMAAAEPGAGPAGGGSVPVLFCFSVFARPSSVPHGAGYELLIQKFLSLYGDQIDMHRKFVVQLFAEEWSQYIDLPKGFLVNERCKVRLVPLQIQVRAGGATGACEGGRAAWPGPVCPAAAAPGPLQEKRTILERAGSWAQPPQPALARRSVGTFGFLSRGGRCALRHSHVLIGLAFSQPKLGWFRGCEHKSGRCSNLCSPLKQAAGAARP